MVEFDTPQLKAIERLAGAYTSGDANNLEPLLSKNYEYEPLPESIDLPKQTKEGHLQMWQGVFSSLNKLELIYHEVTEAPGKVDLRLTCVFSTMFGATLKYDTTFSYAFVEEDGELKILHCKDSGDPKQRSAVIAGTLKAAAERAAA